MPDRPEILEGKTYKVATYCGSMYITINDTENTIAYEIFVTLGKAGGCAKAMTEVIGRLTSNWLQQEGEADALADAMRGINCNGQKSCAHHIGECLRNHKKLVLEERTKKCPS